MKFPEGTTKPNSDRIVSCYSALQRLMSNTRFCHLAEEILQKQWLGSDGALHLWRLAAESLVDVRWSRGWLGAVFDFGGFCSIDLQSVTSGITADHCAGWRALWL